MNEITRKLKSLRDAMKSDGIAAVTLKGVDWFAWATGGGRSTVIFTTEAGIAEIFVTETKAYVLTSNIEKERLSKEEVPAEYEIIAFPWATPSARDLFIQEHIGLNPCYSDRPKEGEVQLPPSFHNLKLVLGAEEISRYKTVGRLAAEAMTEAITQARPDWSENELAGAGAKALWSRGLDPTLVLVGNHRRCQIYRHPVAGNEKLGESAMMVFCARGFGLYANLTRFIFFRSPTAEEFRKFDHVKNVEKEIWHHSVPGKSLPDLYRDLVNAYRHTGFPDEIHRHHQGGITGYLSREFVATPESPSDVRLQEGMALAWNPSLPGAKIEDTVVLGSAGLEILTVDPRWPSEKVNGYVRPKLWVQL